MVQLFVLFEIFHIGNSRSERISLFRLSSMRNPFLLFGTLAALGIHVAALYFPFTSQLLGISPPTLEEWGVLSLAAGSIVVVMELHKSWLNRRADSREAA